MDAPVEVLICTNCGAPLAFGDGDTTKCNRCGTETALAMFARLDSPPSMLTGVLAMTLDLKPRTAEQLQR